VRRVAFAEELRSLVRRTDDIRMLAMESGQPMLTERAIAVSGGTNG